MSEITDASDLLIAAARDNLRRASGIQQKGGGRPHISPLEKKRLTTYLRNYHEQLTSYGIAYQFLEIFLSGVMFFDEKQMKNVVEDNALFASSVLRYDNKSVLKQPDAKTMQRFWRTHPSNITVSDIEARIRTVRAQYTAFMYGSNMDRNARHQYEYFRYFCTTTLISFLTESMRFQFWDLGIQSYFDSIINHERHGNFKPFTFIRHKILKKTKDHENRVRAALLQVFNQRNRVVPERGELNSKLNSLSARPKDDPERLSYEFLDLISRYADALSLTIINSRRLMPLPCYTTFFGFSTNGYPAWVGSFTDSGNIPSQPKWGIPSRTLELESEKINKTIHYPSYRNYIEAFENMLVDDKNDELGIMLLLPFQIRLGNFRKTGFLRAMRRYNPKTQKLILDEFADEYYQNDLAIIDTFKSDVQLEFERYLGTENFLRSDVSKGGRI